MAITEKMWDLRIEDIEDGTINLEQDSGCGEIVRITLHPAQIRLLAERAGLLEPSPVPTWPRGFIRRIKRLRNHAGDIQQSINNMPNFPLSDSTSGEVIYADGLVVEFDHDMHGLLTEFDDLLADYFEAEESAA